MYFANRGWQIRSGQGQERFSLTAIPASTFAQGFRARALYAREVVAAQRVSQS